jgi:anti-sigma28 factor (negative regulator of flagellin synthesis)
MSIQIYNDGLAGAGLAGAGRTQELSHPATGGKSSAGSTGAEDQVQISSLSSTLSSQGSDRAARVQQLAAAYQSGRYEVNPTEVSHALVNHALGAGGVEGGQ